MRAGVVWAISFGRFIASVVIRILHMVPREVSRVHHARPYMNVSRGCLAFRIKQVTAGRLMKSDYSQVERSIRSRPGIIYRFVAEVIDSFYACAIDLADAGCMNFVNQFLVEAETCIFDRVSAVKFFF